MVALLALIGILGVAAGSVVLRGFALSVLWGWFVAPVFGVPELGIAQSLGLAVLLGLFLPNAAKSEEKSTAAAWSAILLGPLSAILIGWIITLFL